MRKPGRRRQRIRTRRFEPIQPRLVQAVSLGVAQHVFHGVADLGLRAQYVQVEARRDHAAIASERFVDRLRESTVQALHPVGERHGPMSLTNRVDVPAEQAEAQINGIARGLLGPV